MNILNIAGYRFVALDELPTLRERIHAAGECGGIRGTVLLAPEGINFFVAGLPEPIRAFRATLDSDCRLAGIDVKESWSDETPFRRLKVKIKREIISLGDPSIDPARHPAPPIEPAELKEWLDAGRDVLLLDTRNAFEAGHGSFAGALHLGNGTFRDFAAAAKSLPIDVDRPIVTYCTGGIRCEKAAPLLRELGHRNVYQLAGGILRYFQDVGSAHYDGTCFVFDERVALDDQLKPRDQNLVQL